VQIGRGLGVDGERIVCKWSSFLGNDSCEYLTDVYFKYLVNLEL